MAPRSDKDLLPTAPIGRSWRPDFPSDRHPPEVLNRAYGSYWRQMFYTSIRHGPHPVNGLAVKPAKKKLVERAEFGALGDLQESILALTV